jgi:hypothetical protein
MAIKLFIIIALAYPHAKGSLKYAHGCVMLIIIFGSLAYQMLVKKDAASGNSVRNYVFCGLEDMTNPLLI